MVHYLQQQIENLGVRFFDFIEQHYRMWILGHSFGQSILPDQNQHILAARRSVLDTVCLFHIFGHVETNQLDPHHHGELRVTSVLPTPVGTGKKERPDRFPSSFNPERPILIAALSASMALS